MTKPNQVVARTKLILANLATSYLRGQGYFVRPNSLPAPKVGDTVEFISGGIWKHNGSYYQTGTVVELDNDHPDRPFVKYGFIRAQTRNKHSNLVSDQTIYPREVIRVIPAERTYDKEA